MYRKEDFVKKGKIIKVSICLVLFFILALLGWKYIHRGENEIIDGPGKPPETLDIHVQEEIKKNYPGWLEALDVPDGRLIGYEGEFGVSGGPCASRQISLSIDDKKGEILNEIVLRDSEFIKKNPNVFSQKEKRMLYCYRNPVSQAYPTCYGYKNYLDDDCNNIPLDISLDGCMRIGFMLENKYLHSPIFDDSINILEIYNGDKFQQLKERSGYSITCILEHDKIKDLKYIILYDFLDGVDKQVEQSIKDIYPDVKVYQVKTNNQEQ